MSKTKFITGILLVLAVLFAQVGSVLAAPAAQDTTPIIGKISDIQLEKDTNGVVTAVVVTLEDGTTVRLDPTVAKDTYDLLTVDPLTNEVIADTSKIGTDITVPSTDVLPDEGTTDEFINPVATILAKFFDLEPAVVQGYHDDGFGFGVIAQALWISRNLTSTPDTVGDASLAKDILTAKQTKNYAAFFNTLIETHPEYSEQFGDNMPTNWGQFKKALMDKKNNLGVIVSGHAENGTDDALNQTGKNNGNGHDKDNKPGKGKGNNKP